MTQQEAFTPRALPDDQREGLLALVGRIGSALAQMDPARFAAEFAEDGAVINPGGLRAIGRRAIEEQIRGDMDRFMRGATTKMDLHNARVVGPGLALLDLNHHMDNATRPDGAKGPFDVHVVALARKSGADWQVLEIRAYAFLPPPPVKH
jgi:uncharacterized protein (TIGR02246 family)